MNTLPEIETVGVVGAGTMGHGIAQSTATAGYEVMIYDVDAEAIENGMEAIEASLSPSQSILG
jgi:3-hydroxybutyryl-CoA dehydrogenase